MLISRNVACGLVLASLMIAGCSLEPHKSSSLRAPIQSFSGVEKSISRSENFSEPPKFNVPSAPIGTPLCGRSLKEQGDAGRNLYEQSQNSGNSCVHNACFQPLTGTFITQNGTNSVCR